MGRKEGLGSGSETPSFRPLWPLCPLWLDSGSHRWPSSSERAVVSTHAPMGRGFPKPIDVVALKAAHLKALTAIVAVALVAGCGSGGSNGTTNSPATGCVWPACVTSLLATCVPSGECTQNYDMTTFASTECYANGVTVHRTVNAAAMSTVETCKNGGAVSYSIETHTELAGNVPTGAAFTITDVSGATVATGAGSDSALVVTCGDGSKATLAGTCALPSTDGVYMPDGGWVTLMCSDSATCVP